MRPAPWLELPPEQEAQLRKARRLEWPSVAYLTTTVIALYLTMGTSQAMRTSFFEDLLSLIPPLAFLIGSRIALRRPGPNFPYGFHAAITIAYLTASLALLSMGFFLFAEAAIKLFSGERTTIGGVQIFGHTVWAGWLMLVVLAYTGVPSFFLGRAKLRLVPRLHDKVLFADAKMNKADWMAEAATAAGVIGTGFGLWWADAVAAALISLDIAHDRFANIGAALTDLLDERPKKTDRSGFEPLPQQLVCYLERLDWVAAAEVRMREQGHVFFAGAFVVPNTAADLVEKIEQAVEGARKLNWRLHDLVIMPVDSLSGDGTEENTRPRL